MRLFQSDQNAVPDADIVHLLWQYEVSVDGGKNWRPEIDDEGRDPDVLRRGTWVAPPVN